MRQSRPCMSVRTYTCLPIRLSIVLSLRTLGDHQAGPQFRSWICEVQIDPSWSCGQDKLIMAELSHGRIYLYVVGPRRPVSIMKLDIFQKRKIYMQRIVYLSISHHPRIREQTLQGSSKRSKCLLFQTSTFIPALTAIASSCPVQNGLFINLLQLEA